MPDLAPTHNNVVVVVVPDSRGSGGVLEEEAARTHRGDIASACSGCAAHSPPLASAHRRGGAGDRRASDPASMRGFRWASMAASSPDG